MKIVFSLGWLPSGNITKKGFKHAGSELLFQEFVSRISKFSSCSAKGALRETFSKNPKTKIWICDNSEQSKIFSSDEIANHFERIMLEGCQELWIAIGGPDGLNGLEKIKPDLKWSFGKLTLPHELAAVVASEQIYRAWTILKHTPYHSGH